MQKKKKTGELIFGHGIALLKFKLVKAIFVRRINIKGCEDYKNTLTRMESDCTLIFGDQDDDRRCARSSMVLSKPFLHRLSA